MSFIEVKLTLFHLIWKTVLKVVIIKLDCEGQSGIDPSLLSSGLF